MLTLIVYLLHFDVMESIEFAHIIRELPTCWTLLTYDDVEAQLTRLGWKAIKPHNRKSFIPFFESPCGKYIIKKGFLTMQETSAYQIATHFFTPSDWTRWMLQPKVDLRPLLVEKALEFFRALGDEVKKFDIHGGNVGYYDGKPVMFDW